MSATQAAKIFDKDKDTEVPKGSHSDEKAPATSQHSPSKDGDNASKTPTTSNVPASLPVRLTRKRAASLMARGETRHPEPLSLTSSPIQLRKADSASQVCLCQPEPKVRRPRNGLFPFSFFRDINS